MNKKYILYLQTDKGWIEEKVKKCDVCHNITEDYETTEDQQVFCIDCMEEHNVKSS